ncbi:NCS2 family permease [Listeria booriae]|uniref:NCS2 family permease n=1 Tax=Listeria booriae TaxID=1552123 RepID=UPI001624A2BF|nr:NCS2 family permease [Listeria booriae]MBC1271416.1 NCS2 family permease [Listeria booriae]
MEKLFKLQENKTTVKTEILAGLTTFLSMAYILFVNPSALSTTGMDMSAVFVATALAAVVGSLLMGLIANYPIGLAPGIGLSSFFAYTVCAQWGIPWETALSGVLVSGCVFIVLTVTGIREKIINAIPTELKFAVGAGIGFFIAFLGLKNAGIIVGNKATLVALGDLHNSAVLLAVFGIVVTIILMTLNINGAIFIGMAATVIVGMIFQLIDVPTQIVAPIPDITPTFGQAIFHLGDIFTPQMLIVILTFFFIDFFDTAGTLVAVANQAGFMKDNKVPRATRALFADSSATIVGSILGTSTTTSYVESTAGVAVGGRTGLTAIVIAICFGLSMFFSPLLGVITSAVTTPALVIVGILMIGNVAHIDWAKFEIAVPCFMVILMMVLSFSIASGIALGFIFYPITMFFKGRYKEVHPIMYILMVLFILYFVFIV